MESHKAKLLLVDDSPANLVLLEKIVEADDRELILASSGVEALKLCEVHDFAIILSDVQMPEMDGFEMLEQLRLNKQTQLVPVIFLTALSKEEKYVHRGYSEGAVDYLFKPLDAGMVKAKVDVFISLYQKQIELEKQAEELRLMNEAKNKFLGMAAHDLRSPIGVISHYSHFLREDLTGILDSKALSYLELIESSGNMMKNLVTELLDLTKIESGVFTLASRKTNLNSLIENAILMQTVYAQRKQISLVLDLDPGIPTVMLDSFKIGQVLSNLISNGIKYSPMDTTIIVQSKFENDQLTISVKDEGMGIAEDEIPQLFDAYTTTSNVPTNGEKSTGLGLMIASKIVKAHDGLIKVESRPGEGSEFTIVLPGTLIQNESSAEIEDTVKARPELNVLVVDDNAILLAIASQLFKLFDVNLVTAEDGVEAMEKMNEYLDNGEKFDILFTDLNMPRMNGLELAETIRLDDRNSDLYIVGLSATMEGNVNERCLNVGMNAFEEKPLVIDMVSRIFDQIVA